MALIGSGLLAMLLVLSRTPGIQDVFPLKEFFRAALVVHVDLSVVVWFMAFAAVIWSANHCAVGFGPRIWSWAISRAISSTWPIIVLKASASPNVA